jgi:hypothetical protein
VREAEGAGSEASWPDLGRVTRECMQIAFSNERARTVLGWRPRYGLPTGRPSPEAASKRPAYYRGSLDGRQGRVEDEYLRRSARGDCP